MSKQIRGIILEGQSCCGKTSVFNALKRCHYEQIDSERNVIFLSEHYSQTLNWVNGENRNLSREENLKVLADRIAMLEQLNAYANSMGMHSRRSRGLFFVFERFHLNYAFSHNDMQSEEYLQIENKLRSLNALPVLLTVSPAYAEARLKHRSSYTGDEVTEDSISKYLMQQERFIEIAGKSSLATRIINTDSMDWDTIAKDLLRSMEVTYE